MYNGRMSLFSILSVLLHVLAAVIWVGGMFFAYVALRPTLGSVEAPVRLTIWNQVFSRFFVWVWTAIILLLATGYAQVIWDFGGFDASGMHVQIMHGTGLLMVAIFLYLFFGPYRRLQMQVAAEAWPEAGKTLAHIRRIVATNLSLGLVTVAIGASGRFWG